MTRYGHTLHVGRHLRVDSAKVWDRPEECIEISVAVSGKQSIEVTAPLADHPVAVEPEADLVQRWDPAKGGTGSRKVGQIRISWGPDEDALVEAIRAFPAPASPTSRSCRSAMPPGRSSSTSPSPSCSPRCARADPDLA